MDICVLFCLNNLLFWKLLVKFQQPWNNNEDSQTAYSSSIKESVFKLDLLFKNSYDNIILC